MPSRPSVVPPPCSFRAEPSKILFSLIEKIFGERAQIQNCKEYFARRRASASGGGAKSGRVFVKVGSDFVQKVPQFFKIGVLGRGCLALAEFTPLFCKRAGLGLGRNEDFIRIFEIQKQFLPAQTEVRRAKLGSRKAGQTNLFSFAFGEKQSDNFKYFDCLIKTI
jgi:hypothetical protein